MSGIYAAAVMLIRQLVLDFYTASHKTWRLVHNWEVQFSILIGATLREQKHQWA